MMRVLSISGTVGLLLGVIDPLEGSIIIVLGGGLLALGAVLGRTPQRTLLVTAFILLVVGVGALFGLSALGGIGGNTGRSMAWLALCVPYPVGWLMALVGAYQGFRRPAERRAHA